MNPFDLPPSSPPVSLDPPPPGGAERPSRRGRMAIVAVAAAGLVGGGLVGVSQLVSADRPTVVSDDAALAAIDAPGDDDAPDIPDDGDAPGPDQVVIDGEIIIDDGDGDPVVIDLGELEGNLAEFQECMGLPDVFDFEGGELPFQDWEHGDWDPAMLDEFFGDIPFGEFGDFGEFEGGVFGGEMFDLDGTHVTVVGPDGVSIIDFGDGDGSVTITKNGDEFTISTDGDATVDELPGPFEIELPGDFDPDADLGEIFGGEIFGGEIFGEDFDPELMLQEFLGEDFDPELMFEEFFGEFGEGEFGRPGHILGGLAEGDLDECLAIVSDG